jgi:hypothetical protein
MTIEELLGTVLSTRTVQRGYIMRTPAELQSAESRAMKSRLGGWCEMGTSLGVSQF